MVLDDGKEMTVTNPSDWPTGKVARVFEPVVKVTILAPSEFIGTIMELCQSRRGQLGGMDYLSESRVELRYTMPLAEIIFDFFDALKSRTRGYACLDYEEAGEQESDLVKVDILLQGEPVDAFSAIRHKDAAYAYGTMMATKLRELIPRQQFEVPIQAAIGSRIIARENIRAIRKDVLAKCYGGDITRKRKLLEKQKEGKKRMKTIGRVEVPQEAFVAALSTDSSAREEEVANAAGDGSSVRSMTGGGAHGVMRVVSPHGRRFSGHELAGVLVRSSGRPAGRGWWPSASAARWRDRSRSSPSWQRWRAAWGRRRRPTARYAGVRDRSEGRARSVVTWLLTGPGAWSRRGTKSCSPGSLSSPTTLRSPPSSGTSCSSASYGYRRDAVTDALSAFVSDLAVPLPGASLRPARRRVARRRACALGALRHARSVRRRPDRGHCSDERPERWLRGTSRTSEGSPV